METFLCQYLKYLFHRKQFFHLLEIYFKRILYCSLWQWIFFIVETIFFHSHFLETIKGITGRQIFLKNLVSAGRNRFLKFSSDTDSNESSFLIQRNRIFQGILYSGWWKAVFPASGNGYFIECFILANGNGFST